MTILFSALLFLTALQASFQNEMTKCGTYELTAKVGCEKSACSLTVNPGTTSEFRYETQGSGKLLLYNGRYIRAVVEVLSKDSPYTGKARLKEIKRMEPKRLDGMQRIKPLKTMECGK